MNETARDIMTRDVILVEETTSLNNLIALFLDHKISCAPVVNEKKELVGIVTKTDVLGHFMDIDLDVTLKVGLKDILDLSPEHGDFELTAVTELKVKDIMTRDPITVGEDTNIKILAGLMIDNSIHRLVVLRDGVIVGIISTLDLLYYVAGKEKNERG